MPKVAVLTVSKRTGWESVARDSLKQQTVQDFEYVLVHRNLYQPHIRGKQQTRVEHHAGKISDLNHSLNQGLEVILRNWSVDYVIFYQDFIELPPDCFEKLINDAEETGRFITTATINHDGTMDGRYTGKDTLRPCEPAEWEANVAIAPMKAIIELGGFDEEYDNGWSWDNVNLAERARLLGYKFCIDESIKPQLLYHPKEPDINPDLKPNGDFHAIVMREIAEGKRPIKLDYLNK